jgi:hypothetical protein
VVPTGTSKTKSASFRTSLRQRFVISRGQAKRWMEFSCL